MCVQGCRGTLVTHPPTWLPPGRGAWMRLLPGHKHILLRPLAFLTFRGLFFFNFKLCPESLRKLEHLAPTSTCVEYAAGGQLVRRFKLQTCNRRLFFLCVQKQKATVRTRARTRARPGAHISDTVRMTEAAASVISGSR